uniref:Small-subunit processome n=1 Tax=Caenorhabditis tropicalis TaxID=1561998 RepID=A0A1I7UY30_9PELO
MSDDSDIDDIAHQKLLQSIQTPGIIKKNRLRKSAKTKTDATSLLSHITVSRPSAKKARQSLGIDDFASSEKSTVASSSKKRKSEAGAPDEVSNKKKLKSKTLIPLKDVEARKEIEGKIAFSDLKKEVTQNWTELVQSNRISDQLIFPLTKPDGILWGDEKIEPVLTEKEMEVMKATDIKMAKERLSQMQRMRAIVGIQEAKNRYMNKIKSKGYHRILKREKRKQLLKEFDDLVTRDPAAAHEKLAEMDLQRIMERGSLKHRGQNQKFKQMLEKHASRNPEVKKLLDEHLRMGRELKAKVISATGDSDNEESTEGGSQEKKKSIHDLLKDAAQEAEKESKKNIGAALVDSFLEDTEAQKITLAQLRAKKRQEAAVIRSISVNAKNSSDHPLFEVDETWQKTEELKKEKKKKKELKERERKRKGTVGKTSYVDKNYDPKLEAKRAETFDEKVEKAVEAAGVHDAAKRQKEIEIDPRKFLELNTNDLTQVSSEFVEKMDEFDEEAAQVINEAFKDDDVVGDFEEMKEGIKEKEKVKDVDLNLAGWGSWVGPGMTEKKRRHNFVIKAKEKKRRDGERNGLIIGESMTAKDGIGKIQPRSLPFPYSRVEDYEAVLKQPLGLEWNMEKMRDELCKPAVVVEAGRAIRPINKKHLLGD